MISFLSCDCSDRRNHANNNVSFTYLQRSPGGHTVNAWKMEGGDRGRILLSPGGMTQNVKRTITSKTRYGEECKIQSLLPLSVGAENTSFY